MTSARILPSGTEEIFIVSPMLVIVSLVLLVFYWWLRKVQYVVRDISEMGYDHTEIRGSRLKSRRVRDTDTSRQNLERQMPPVFPNGWIPVAVSNEIQAGKAKPLNVLGEELVIFRTETGEVYILDAYCPHLGAHLGVGGKVVGDCIECPFHGWRFSGPKGNCTLIPYVQTMPEFIKTRSWTCKELLGLVFLWYHAENAEPEWDIPDIPEVTQNKWNLRSYMEHNIKCHIQEIPENGADVAHLNQIHAPNFMAGGDYLKASESCLNRIMHHSWKATWNPNPEPEQHMATMKLKCRSSILSFWPNFLNYDVEVSQIGPALVFIRLSNDYGKGVMIQSVTPEGPFRQRVVHRFFVDSQFPLILAKFLSWSSGSMFERDIMVWNNKVFLKNPLLVSEDRAITRFRKWYSQFYSEHSPHWEDVMKKSTRLEW